KGESQGYGFPALFKTSAGIWVLLTEAAVYGDYAGARLHGRLGRAGIFEVKLPEGISSRLPWTTPWRVAIVGERLGTIVESVVVDNLNPPCEVDDLSWIKPGRVTFPWWSEPKVNKNYERLKEFVDFAAQTGWEWIEFDTALIDGSNRGTDTWMRTQWAPELVEYANTKGVNVYGWDNWKNLDTAEKREKVFGLFNKSGIKGIKIDFLNSDSQERFRFRDDAIRDCLKHKLMLSFHGATIPRGRQRRWPHIATWEGVHGAEYYMNWSGSPNPPSHNCALPFTRNVVGSMDYTPVTFSTERRGTADAHELALSVIFESGWQCLADGPESYAKNRGAPFLREVPAAWDDIHFVDGCPGKFVCLARREGGDWFVAGINAGEARELTVSLEFLKQGAYSVRLYRDGANGKEMAVEELSIETTEGLRIVMEANGGFGVRFSQ
ncbi:MAG: glycoside hydrolase family 97 catalytic domain-containing protein, partial [Planctomycetota bacterium]